MTVLYYLNDVVRGGETAFPVADEEDFNQTVIFPVQFLFIETTTRISFLME